MGIFDRFKKKPVEPIESVERIVEKLPEEKVLQGILVELRIANELTVFKLNPDDEQRKLIVRERGETP